MLVCYLLSIFVSALCFSCAFKMDTRNYRWKNKYRGFRIRTSSTDAYNNVEIFTLKIIESHLQSFPDSTERSHWRETLNNFVAEYIDSCKKSDYPSEKTKEALTTFVQEVIQVVHQPFAFNSHHKALRQPIDYYKWGNDFFRPLVIQQRSKLLGEENLYTIQQLLQQNHNVVILSNHQTEADPQVISLLLERHNLSKLAEQMIFLAGHKVTNDPIAVPFSKGRDLICIHSKKHIKSPPEEFQRKQKQNLASMKVLSELATEGGKIFWVAPSGGRDRPKANDLTKFAVADFDPSVIEMFKYIAIVSKKPMHFFPMAMYTHQLVPPPKTISSAIGEQRSAARGEVSIHFLEELELGNKDQNIISSTETIQRIVEEAYEKPLAWHNHQLH